MGVYPGRSWRSGAQGGIHLSSIEGYRKISPRTYCSATSPSPILRASQGRKVTVIAHSMGHMRPTIRWGMWISFVSLCGLVPLLQSPRAAGQSPERLDVAVLCQAMPSRCPQGVAQTPADDLWTYDGPMLQLSASAPPEDPIASDCRYV